MVKHWAKVNFDITNAIKSDFDFDLLYKQSKDYGKSVAIWNFYDNQIYDLFQATWLKEMSDAGFPPRSAMIFYRAPHYQHPSAHVDIKWTGDVCPYALNWTLNPDDDSEMQWYEVELKSGKLEEDPIKKYIYWPMDEVKDKIIDRKCIATQPTLVDTGTAHNIIMGVHPRWVISVRFDTPEITTWIQALDYFKNFIE